jgi:large subunit ribosomal protein L22
MKKPVEKDKNLAESPGRAAKAVAKYLRISPRKVRLVINTIRHRHVTQAFPILMSLKKKAARMAEKVLRSAVANAKVLGLDENRLYIADIRADGGPTLKRFMARSMGRADRILKRTTHLSLVVQEGKKAIAKPGGETGRMKEKKPKRKKEMAEA